MVKGLIELHKGSVHVTSSGLGLGAEFSIRLPLVTNGEYIEYVKERKPATQRVSRLILIIDDNKDVSESLSMLLETFGHRVNVASTGSVGLQKALQIKPDCVLCDIGLPGINGYQVAQAFRTNPLLSSTYLIALSGYAQPTEIEKAMQAGFDLHLAKPPNFDLLDDVLCSL